MGMDNVALGWLVLEMTNSPFMVGVTFTARLVPQFVFGILSGAVADRVGRRALLRYLSLGAGVNALLLASLLLMDAAAIWLIIIWVVMAGSLFAFIQTARYAYTYDVVGKTHALGGLALTGIGARVGGIGGALLSGVLVVKIGIGVQYLFVCVAYLSAGIVCLAMRHPGYSSFAKRDSIMENLVGYVQIVRGNLTLQLLMLLTSIIGVLGFSIHALLPVLARDVLDVGADGLGIMNAVTYTGGMLGMFLVASMGDFIPRGRLLFMGMLGCGLGLMALFLVTSVVGFLTLLCFVSACMWVTDPITQALMQNSVADNQRGRAMGSWSLSVGVMPAGTLATGWLAQALGAPLTVLINGGALVVIGLVSAIGMPRIRRLQ